ncbi:MAG: hypothetical protein K8I27_09625 [Planctomycetes bacterium]|nr:hypothetical protein [Planctomycetota bacterium]
MSELPNDPIDELIQRAHNNARGAPPSFKGRLRARMAAEATVWKQTRALYIKLVVAVAAVLVVALAVGMNVELFLPNRSNPAAPPPPQARDDQPAPVNVPAVQPEPGPQPEPRQSDDSIDKPTPGPQPEPAQPDDIVDEPAPEPRQPDDTVEKPKPKQPEPDAEPEPRQPDDTVDTSKPKQPEGTKAEPESETRIAVATLIGTAPRVQLCYGVQDWREPEPNEVLYSGVQLKAGRSAVDIMLAGGAYARFDGELRLERVSDTYTFVLSDDTLYVDNLSLGTPVHTVAHGFKAEMVDGAGLFYSIRNGQEVACLAGEISLQGETLTAATVRKATERGVSEPRAWKGDRFLRDLPARVLVREDFDVPPPGGMYDEGERLEDGIAIMDKAPRYIAFRHNPTFEVLPGTVLRVRLRTTNVSRLELELFALNEIELLKKNPEVMFKQILTPETNGEWFEIVLPIEEIPDNKDAEHFLQHGDLLRNFKLHYVGDKLELDFVEFVRVQE